MLTAIPDTAQPHANGHSYDDEQYQQDPVTIVVHFGVAHSPRMYAVVITLPVAGVNGLLNPGPPKPKVSPWQFVSVSDHRTMPAAE